MIFSPHSSSPINKKRKKALTSSSQSFHGSWDLSDDASDYKRCIHGGGIKISFLTRYTFLNWQKVGSTEKIDDIARGCSEALAVEMVCNVVVLTVSWEMDPFKIQDRDIYCCWWFYIAASREKRQRREKLFYVIYFSLRLRERALSPRLFYYLLWLPQ